MTGPTIDRLPTAEEILAGETQAGVSRPNFSFDDIVKRATAPQPASAILSRWQAVKALMRVILKGL